MRFWIVNCLFFQKNFKVSAYVLLSRVGMRLWIVNCLYVPNVFSPWSFFLLLLWFLPVSREYSRIMLKLRQSFHHFLSFLLYMSRGDFSSTVIITAVLWLPFSVWTRIKTYTRKHPKKHEHDMRHSKCYKF